MSYINNNFFVNFVSKIQKEIFDYYEVGKTNELKILIDVHQLISEKKSDLLYDGFWLDCFVSRYEIGLIIYFISTFAFVKKALEEGFETSISKTPINVQANFPALVKKSVKSKKKQEQLPEKFLFTPISGPNMFLNKQFDDRPIFITEWRIYYNIDSKTLKTSKKEYNLK